MADTSTNQASDDASKKKSGSPWDEDLPEEPKKTNVVGSLDAKPSDLSGSNANKKPVPFNIPANVNEEKVGKKIPAETVITKPAAPTPPPTSPSTPNMPKTNAIPVQNTPPKSVGQKEGVHELIKPKAGPATPPAPSIPTPPPPPPPPAPLPVAPPVKPSVPVTPEPAPEKMPVPISPAPVANLKTESGTLADIKPANNDKEPVPPILPDISKPINLAEEKEEGPLAEKIRQAKQARAETESKPAPAEIRKPVVDKGPPFYKKAKFFIPAIAIFLFVLGVYLTEAGVIGIGLENVYGLTGVESLWGGLPRNPEKALGISAQTMQKQLNFKIKGSISMTVNKTIKSPVTSPLVSFVNLPYAFRDTNAASGMSAIVTQYDYYGSNSSSTSSDSSTSSSSSSTPSTSSSSTDSQSTSSTTPALGDQSSSASYKPEESTIKQVDADITGQSNDEAIQSDFILKKLVGSSSSVSLIDTKNQLFVKTSPDIQFATNAEQSKWLEFSLSPIQNQNPFKDFTTIKLDQGFSIIGRRSGNEKVGSVRCFKYTIDNLEIGDSLGFLGIQKDSVQKIEGSIWVGAADHYLHKIDLKIIPSISSSISQMNITLEMYDYGVENSITIPALADKIVANGATVTATPTPTATQTTPTIAAAVTAAERDQTRKQDLQKIKAALENYKAANGKFPIARSTIHLDAKDNVVQKALVPDYIASIPTDPNASDGWFYGYKSDGSTFTLSARLENPADPQVTKVGDIYLHWVYNN